MLDSDDEGTGYNILTLHHLIHKNEPWVKSISGFLHFFASSVVKELGDHFVWVDEWTERLHFKAHKRVFLDTWLMPSVTSWTLAQKQEVVPIVARQMGRRKSQ